MKKCPNCRKTYEDDNLKFCQTDGTPLVADEVEIDPYKTVVGNQSDISNIIAEQEMQDEPESVKQEADPFQTMVAPPPSTTPPQESVKDEEDILDIFDDDDDEDDLLKTKIIPAATSDNIKVHPPEEKPKDPAPPVTPAKTSFENKQDSSFKSSTPERPQFNEPNIELPQAEDFTAESNESANINEPTFSEPQTDLKTGDESSGGDNISDNQSSSIPIASPFDQSMPPGYAPPETPPFEPPKDDLVAEPLNEPKFEPPQSPFAEPEINSPIGQSEDWSQPNASVSDWENKEVGQNTPFETPQLVEGQNMTLSYVSLATGILSMTICCWVGIVMGPAAMITGYLARGKVNENPTQYGGEKFALIGMITGAIGILAFILFTVFWYFSNALVSGA